MSSSSDKSQSKRTQRETVNFCSTPVVNEVCRLSNISISAVEENSSSSNKNVSRNTKTKFTERKKKTRSKKQKRKIKQQPKKDSDSDWETRSEQSVHEETLLQDSIKKTISDSDNDILFKDITTPERVREAPPLVEDRLESPVLRFNQWQIESPKRISFGEEDALPLKEVPFPTVRLDDTDDDEQSLSLRRENAIKTYPGVRHMRQSKKNVGIEKGKQWLINLSVPTTLSDQLWDDFVTNNKKKVNKYLATFSNCKQKSSKYNHHEGKRDKDIKDRDSNAIVNEECDHKEENVKEKGFQLHIRENMQVVRGYWDKSLRKWVHQMYDEYNFPEHEDVEFGKKSETGSRMRLNQFLRKCRAEKETVKEQESSLFKSWQSSSERDLKETRNKKRKRSISDFKSDLKRPKVLPVDVLDSELKRIDEIRKYIAPLNANEKMISNELSLDQTTVPAAPSRLKRVNKQNINGAENASKRQRITTNNEPHIRAVELLTTIQYDKEKHMWRTMLH